MGYGNGVNWQQVASLMVVGVTAGIFLANKLRPRKFSLQRDTHCGCSASGSIRPQTSVVFRARRGERPEIHVRMG